MLTWARRLVVTGCVMGAGVATLLPSPALAKTGNGSWLGCQAVLLAHASAKVPTRQVVRTDQNGVATLTVTIVSTRAAGTYGVRDCAFVDKNNDNKLGLLEPYVNYYNDAAAFTAVPGGSKFSFTVKLNAIPTAKICGRVVHEKTKGSGRFADTSIFRCVLGTPPDVPEVASSVLLPLSGVVLAGAALGAVAWRKRRGLSSPA